MKKADLREGDFITLRCGLKGVVEFIDNSYQISIPFASRTPLTYWNGKMTHIESEDSDIVEVVRVWRRTTPELKKKELCDYSFSELNQEYQRRLAGRGLVSVENPTRGPKINPDS